MQQPTKFKRQVFVNNVMRIKAVIMEFVAVGKFIESCLEWEHPVQSALAFAAFMAGTWYFQVSEETRCNGVKGCVNENDIGG